MFLIDVSKHPHTSKKKDFFTVERVMGNFCGLANDRNRDAILERQRPVFDAIEKGDMKAMYQCLQDMKNENEEKKEGTTKEESFVNWTNKEEKHPFWSHANMRG